jgi:hypothetical protein
LSAAVVEPSGPLAGGRRRVHRIVFMPLAGAIVVAVFLLSAAPALATTTDLYAVPTGGAGSGLCPASDPCTLSAALSTATTDLAGDDVVIVRPPVVRSIRFVSA